MTELFKIKNDQIFISYRRSDSESYAREIYRAITDVLPPENVFLDQESIPPGVNFLEFLEARVSKCDVLLALIGPVWVDAMNDGSGIRRLDSSDDLVRLELRKGLERRISVVPVLLDGTRMPDKDELPNDLKTMVWQNAVCISAASIGSDVVQLLTRIGVLDPAASEVYGKAIAGDAEAMWRLGRAYANGLADARDSHGEDRAPFYLKRALEWCDTAVEVGGSEQWRVAGEAYLSGYHVPYAIPEDRKKGRALLEKAYRADPADETAFSLAWWCYREEQPEKAIELYKKFLVAAPSKVFGMRRLGAMTVLVELLIDANRHFEARRWCSKGMQLATSDYEKMDFRRLLQQCNEKIGTMSLAQRILGRLRW